MHIDLHTHSTASDGTLSPAALVQMAGASGVECLALTDHDTTAGVEEARQAALDIGMELVAGVEISVTWGSETVHVLGLRVDPGDLVLQEGLQRINALRASRAQEIGKRLACLGIEQPHAAVSAQAGAAYITRTHFARLLVERGRVPTVHMAFEQFLGPGRPAYVAVQWARLDEAVAWVSAAGGAAAIAHPARLRIKRHTLLRLLSEFKDCGGVGLEVVSGTQTLEECLLMAHYARQFGLLATVGSDYHGPQQSWAGPGQMPGLPQGCRPIWETWERR